MSKPWTEEEFQMLEQFRETFPEVHYVQLLELFPGRTKMGLKMAYHRRNGGRRKHSGFPWTSIEDERLRMLKRTTDWTYAKIAEHFMDPKRTPHSCCTRWSILQHDIASGDAVPYTSQEDAMLLMARKHRISWRKIQESFPTRSVGGLMKYWVEHLEPHLCTEDRNTLIYEKPPPMPFHEVQKSIQEVQSLTNISDMDFFNAP